MSVVAEKKRNNLQRNKTGFDVKHAALNSHKLAVWYLSWNSDEAKSQNNAGMDLKKKIMQNSNIMIIFQCFNIIENASFKCDVYINIMIFIKLFFSKKCDAFASPIK